MTHNHAVSDTDEGPNTRITPMATSDDDAERMARMQAALDAAEKALEPFARLADVLTDGGVDVAVGLTDEHFLAARSALAQIKQVKGE